MLHDDFDVIIKKKGSAEQELNKKLAEWAGFKRLLRAGSKDRYYWEIPDGRQRVEEDFLPDFTQSLDACFKWLVPRLKELCSCNNGHSDNDLYMDLRLCDGQGWTKSGWMCVVRCYRSIASVDGIESPALALCLAIEKLIDSEAK